MTKHSTEIAPLRSLREIVDEYTQKREAIPALCKDYAAYHNHVSMQTSIAGAYVGRPYNYHPSLSERTCIDLLCKSAWRHVYDGLNIKRIASAKDRKSFELTLENPPEFTLENIRETFADYLMKPRFHILKGLAECFADLDPAFKSHTKIKIGVAGLPKRIIIRNVTSDHGMLGYGGERLKDTLNAIRVYEGKPHMEYAEYRNAMDTCRKSGEIDFDGITLKVFKNGNGHLFFGPEKLLMINKALAEFYGEVLADVSDTGEVKPRKSTAVSKDLQYYPTPRKVIDHIIRRDLNLQPGMKIMEPSCGDGVIMEALRENQHDLNMIGIEYHGGRVEQAKQKGLRVVQGNFLEVPPTPRYDLILMNPPFYGTHWKKHLEHALKFLKPRDPEKRYGNLGGMLVCILPATAFYDGHLGEMGLVPENAHTEDKIWRDTGWNDLPVASFADSGTNVPTGYFITSRR